MSRYGKVEVDPYKIRELVESGIWIALAFMVDIPVSWLITESIAVIREKPEIGVILGVISIVIKMTLWTYVWNKAKLLQKMELGR